MAKALTVQAIEKLQERTRAYEVGDAAARGLQLRVTPKGAKSWHWRFRWGKKQVRLVLGTYPKVGLREAHDKVTDARKALSGGIDPRRAGLVLAKRVKPERGAPSSPAHSVEHLAREFMTRHVMRERRRPEYVQRVLDTEVLPQWGSRDARTIKPREVIERLDEIADRAPIMANRVAGILGQMFRFGIHRAIVETSPVMLLYRPGGKEKARTRSLSDEELAALLKNIDDACRLQRLPRVLTVLLLTLQRRGELARATWREFDFKARTWKIPDEHAKGGRGHLCPLTDWAVAELKKLKTIAGRSRYVLPNADGTAPANPLLITRGVARCLKRFKAHGVSAFRAHDLRRSGRTGLARLGVSSDTAERVLNHRRGTIEAVYDVHHYDEEKRAALEKWEAHLRGLVSV